MKKIMTVASVLGAFLSASFQDVNCMHRPHDSDSDISSPETLSLSQTVASEDSCSSEGSSPTIVSEDSSDSEEFLRPHKRCCFQKDDDFPSKSGMKGGVSLETSGHEELVDAGTKEPKIIVKDIRITTEEEFDGKLRENTFFRTRLSLETMQKMFGNGFNNQRWEYYGTCMGASKGKNVINVIALNGSMLEKLPYKDGKICDGAIEQINSENNGFPSSVFLISSSALKKGEKYIELVHK